MKPIPILALTLILLACNLAEGSPSCEWCGAPDAPDRLSWSTTIAPPDEGGEPLVLTGVVYAADGTTPLPGVLVYAYHTNAGGIYPRRGDERGKGRRHGRLRGWIRTNEQGEYRFRTIRPGGYPGRRDPAHVHMTLTPPDGPERWIDDVVFTDDPRVTEDYRRRSRSRGGSGISTPVRDESGTWHVRRDIVLPPP
ncbi:MAG TPA: intradiol ring-cleavage dioxygenase [Thermoanaerobaculia bacterium]|nr:intradiol ring-cleavage dioxygenase [Thermoanaerobaculia bacterium]